jgi:maleate isomerase
MVEYARKGLIGVLTPQANTTVEPEFSILMPPGYAFLTARMVSDKPTLEGRLGDYFASMQHSVAQFAGAPMKVAAFACTGASYLQGIEREGRAVEAVQRALGIAFVTAGQAVADALRGFGARRIALVSPYPPALTEASIDYWRSHGFDIVRVTNVSLEASKFHPIYDLAASSVEDALGAIDLNSVEAAVILGTGMPSLGPILKYAGNESFVPIISCTSALVWRCLMVFDPKLAEQTAMRHYFNGDNWRERFSCAMA